MYIIDGIAYASDPTPVIRVRSVRPLDDYKLWLRFTTGEIKIFDFSPLLDKPCFLPLKDKIVFDSVYVDYGCTVWNDGDIDISPSFLYDKGVLIGGIESA